MGNNREPRVARRVAAGGVFAGLLALLALISLALWNLTRDEPAVPVTRRPSSSAVEVKPVERPPAVSQDYVGSSACRECHREVWERYQSHPMAHSLQPAAVEDGLEDYGGRAARFIRGVREYYVERRGSSVFHHERQSDAQGTIYDQAVEVHYAVGSGTRGRSYVIERGGHLFLSPISWYSQAHRWDLSPGYDEHDHQRFERPVTARCIGCHAGRVALDSEWADRFHEPAIVEPAIGCERCHGPGGAHVAWHKSDEPPERAQPSVDPIVNPARLEAERREAVCNQCHLHGELEVLRYGRVDLDFRPGMHPTDVWAAVVTQEGRGSGSTVAVSQVQQMQASACSRKSGGRLGCISCHDPHFVPDRSEQQAFYREKCLACHGESDCQEALEIRQAAPIHDGCTVCHMPRLRASDVPHTAQTDHAIPRRPSVDVAPEPGQPLGSSGPSSFDLRRALLSGLDAARVQGIALARLAESKKDRNPALEAIPLLERAVKAAPDDWPAGNALAIARLFSGQTDRAVEAWQALLDVRPTHEAALQSLAVVEERRGLLDDSLSYYDRFLAADPWHAREWLARGRILRRLGRNGEALASTRRALELNPALLEAYREAAELARREALTEKFARLTETLKRLEDRARE